MNKYDVIVIGGGAAGMIAAGRAASMGKKVLLVEKNEKLGKKVYITGKGRCNVTNSADLDDMIKCIPVNGRFMYSALSKFSNWDLIALLYENGTPTKEERGGRMFPESDKSSDIIKALSKYALGDNVLLLHGEVLGLIINDKKVLGVELKSGDKILADKVIVATGGKSYPQTGSTGDGYRFARLAGHTVVKPKAALVPLVTKEKWISNLQGLSLKNIGIEVTENGKTIYEDFGEMLFTHFGLSGPVILSSSIHMSNFKDNEYKVKIDLKPALSFETLDKRLLREFAETKNKDYANSLDSLLPKKLIPVIIRESGINPRKKVNEITKEERQRLCNLLKSFEFTVTGLRPIEEAIVTSGGVSVGEINPKTMESKIVEGLFFAGEVIDVCAYTGGYNLQIAFSTGYVAGSEE
ncbi:MAG: NAD(P)/FAD-dependent oxidoreductase [Ruminococcaceae bacterium]|nr:NAD(P)/FAD-dependent oxidoreductase [Oscillospiraceae bacterium]